jgi:hypothetical protein
VTSVGLSAPASDFTVTGSPVTESGKLGFKWKVAPGSAGVANSIVKRDATGGFQANHIEVFGDFAASGTTFLTGPVGVGTNSPQATLNVDVQGQANSDTFLIGNTSTKGLQLRDTGAGVDIEALGTALYINYVTEQPTYFGGPVGIGTTGPQAELNLNAFNFASQDALLIGNNTTKGLQLRDTGTGVDIESIGVPLYMNYTTQQAISLNQNGGAVFVDIAPSTVDPAALNAGAIDYNGDFLSAYFTNDTVIGGNLYVAGQTYDRVDHPLNPTNQYLQHAAIESSEVLDQYSGNVVLDSRGEARVEFPNWFAAINEDFRYQLTAIGAPGPNLYISEEITDNSFTIAGGKPGMKVSWQVTARRNDPYIKAHPFEVEKDKPARERGYYDHPELYGAPKEMGAHEVHQPAKRP